MDPALRELLWRGEEDDEVEAVIRLAEESAEPPPGVRLVARFGAIATCRLKRAEIPRVREHAAVASLKAPRLIAPDAITTHVDGAGPRPDDARRPAGLVPRGHDVCIGVLDWGLDFVRHAFRRPDGRTRIVALWDQRNPSARLQRNSYGYGTIHTRDAIDQALRSAEPYVALGYHPADADPHGIGAHGTVVVDLAAGNGRSGGPPGVAPAAHIVFVHLSSRGTGGLANLGDSIGILEGLDFIHRAAGDRPTAISLSVGRHGGPHDGSTLVELAIDALLTTTPGRTLAQSAGNYRLKQTHVSGVLAPATVSRFRLIVDAPNPSVNELEVWHDTNPCSVRLDAPDATTSGWVPVDAVADLVRGGRLIARVYHRGSDPQNRSNHVDAFIYPGAPTGEWVVWLRDDRSTGAPQRFHAWIERDDACAHCQSRFRLEEADRSCTLGTLATGRCSLVCGAFDSHEPGRPAAPFSSDGPTRDSRGKPDLAAPGVGILALRSQPRARAVFPPFVRKSGTSMTAPQVAGCAALLLEVTGGRLRNEDVREILLSTVDPAPGSDVEGRLGAGYLNIERAIALGLRGRRVFVERGRSHLAAKEDVMTDNGELETPVGREISAGRLFRSVARGVPVEGLQVVAVPGEAPPTPLQAGDLMVRVALGEPGLDHVAVLVDGGLRRPHEFSTAGFALEGREPGFYAQVVEGGPIPHTGLARFARRVLDVSGQVPPGQLLLRPTSSNSRLGRGAGAPLSAHVALRAISGNHENTALPNDTEIGVPPADSPSTAHTEAEQETALLEPAVVADERFTNASENLLASPVHRVLDPEARIRSGPPDFRSTGGHIPYWTRIWLNETRGEYVRVTGADGTAYGWTKASNVGTFFKDLPHLSSARLEPAPSAAAGVPRSDLGKALANTYNRLGGLMALVGAEAGVTLAAALAVWYVESAGRRHTVGRAIIRFENHLFFDRWGGTHPDVYDRHFRHGGRAGIPDERWRNHGWRDDPSRPFAPFHGSQDAEYGVLEFATRLSNEDTALQCISIGGSQILVSNYRMIGYDTARAMYDAFQADERAHVLGFFDFCNYRYGHGAKRGELLRDLAALRWEDFARGYNGGGQVARYAGELQNGYEEGVRIVSASNVAPAEGENDHPVSQTRDPFARPGQPGNRWLSYGQDGAIPAKFREEVDKAIDVAYKLYDTPGFREAFRRTVSTLRGKNLPESAYLDVLDRMVVHLAETSEDSRAKQELQKDTEARKSDSAYKSPPAFSVVNGRDVWLREFILRQGVKAIASSLVHEAAHLAGAPADPLAEWALDAIHNAARLPR